MPSRNAASPVVPVPANISSTVPPFGVTRRTRYCIRSSGLRLDALSRCGRRVRLGGVEETGGAAGVVQSRG